MGLRIPLILALISLMTLSVVSCGCGDDDDGRPFRRAAGRRRRR
ncbi:MAG: hypothetical protein M5R36_14355 [Deltaproteobacteria bacterium]|nr:hypothetical protein [Deltaproteobacteria bacterium]